MSVSISRFSGPYGFLSNFHTCPPGTIYLSHYDPLDTDWYPSTEHAYQASKLSSWVRGLYPWQKISPVEAKRIGGHQGTAEWHAQKLELMLSLLRLKFTVPHLRTRLLATTDSILIEGNLHHDNWWGSCSCRNCEGYVRERHNHLGRLLVVVREEIRNGKA